MCQSLKRVSVNYHRPWASSVTESDNSLKFAGFEGRTIRGYTHKYFVRIVVHCLAQRILEFLPRAIDCNVLAGLTGLVTLVTGPARGRCNHRRLWALFDRHVL